MNWYLLRDEYRTALTDGVLLTALLLDPGKQEVMSFMPRSREMQIPYLWKKWEEPKSKKQLSYPAGISRFLLSRFGLIPFPSKIPIKTRIKPRIE